MMIVVETIFMKDIRVIYLFVFSGALLGFVLREISDPEAIGDVEIELNITNPLSTEFTVRVTSEDGTAIGKKKVICTFVTTIILQEEVLIMFPDHTMSHFLLERPVLRLV